MNEEYLYKFFMSVLEFQLKSLLPIEIKLY